MSTIHLIYPHAKKISTPDAIGRKSYEILSKHYHVLLHEWDAMKIIQPQKGDVLIGHPHPAPYTCFRMSISQPGWKRVIALSPYCHEGGVHMAFFDPIIGKCNLYLAITGNYWYDHAPQHMFAHWFPKMVHMDLAVDRRDFPPLKKIFNPVGKRRFVYIGNTSWGKNVTYLSEIANKIPEYSFSWIGRGETIPGVESLGFQNFSNDEAKQLLASFDFMITVGKADANPTTILESMAWGLIPVCTPQSGYYRYPGIFNIPLDNLEEAIQQLTRLQQMPEVELYQIQHANWQLLDTHFTWERFSNQIMQAIESNDSPALLPISMKQRLTIRWNAFISPLSFWRDPRLYLRPIYRSLYPIKNELKNAV